MKLTAARYETLRSDGGKSESAEMLAWAVIKNITASSVTMIYGLGNGSRTPFHPPIPPPLSLCVSLAGCCTAILVLPVSSPCWRRGSIPVPTPGASLSPSSGRSGPSDWYSTSDMNTRSHCSNNMNIKSLPNACFFTTGSYTGGVSPRSQGTFGLINFCCW